MIHQPSLTGHQLAQLDAGKRGANGAQGTAVFARGVRLGVPGLHVPGAAAEPDELRELLVCGQQVSFGTRRERYNTAFEVQCYSGIAPVKTASGKTIPPTAVAPDVPLMFDPGELLGDSKEDGLQLFPGVEERSLTPSWGS